MTKLNRLGNSNYITLLGHLGAIITVSAWGASFVFTKVLMEDGGFTPVEVYVYRFAVAYLLLLCFAFKKISHKFSDIVLSFAAGVMLAAAVLGLVLPSLEYGGDFSLPITIGGIFAGDMEWNVTVKAADGRASTAIDCCGSMLRAFHSARMNSVTPFEGLTITCCIFQADQQEATCCIGGICRFHHRDKAGLPMKRAVRRVVDCTASAYGCQIAELTLSGPKEGLLNDPTCYQIAKEAIAKNLGPEFVCDTDPTMGGESFTALSSYYPSVMALLGMRDEARGFTAELHSPKFEANEAALKYGVAAHVSYALSFLQHKGPIPFDPFVGDFDAFLQARQAD